MRAIIAALLLLPCLAFGQFYFFDSQSTPILFWDATAGSPFGACSDTTFSVTGAGNDTSCAFLVTPDMTLQVYLKTADADSLCKVQFKLIYSPAHGANGPTYAAFTDSICGNKATQAQIVIAYDSTRITATGWQYPVDISTDCPQVWARLVADGQVTNGSTTATTGSARVLRYKNP